jgi:hypothetical protein
LSVLCCGAVVYLGGMICLRCEYVCIACARQQDSESRNQAHSPSRSTSQGSRLFSTLGAGDSCRLAVSDTSVPIRTCFLCSYQPSRTQPGDFRTLGTSLGRATSILRTGTHAKSAMHLATHIVQGTGDVCLNLRLQLEDFRHQIFVFLSILIERRAREVTGFYLTKNHTSKRYPAGAIVAIVVFYLP